MLSGTSRTVVITGSTRGIGFGLAEAFLELGCAVVISGRRSVNVTRAVKKLGRRHNRDHIFGTPCDVTDFKQVQRLWNRSLRRFGTIDIWINNAGISNLRMPLWETTSQEAESVVRTNLLGVIYGSQVAVRGMLKQGSGSVYSMEGLGANGRKMKGLIYYGTTKYGVDYFTRGLVLETMRTPVTVGLIRPGMIMTDMIRRQYENRPEEWERAKKIFSIIADDVNTVAPWIARKVLANRTNGALIRWLTLPKMIWRFLASPFRKRSVPEFPDA